MADVTIADLQNISREIYRSASFFERLLCLGRPHICPFHVLMKHVPQGSRVLDIGCGAGLFLNYLGYTNQIASGVGIDAANKPIEVAQDAVGCISTDAKIRFEHRAVEQGLPEIEADVVSMIDVLHHVDPKFQKSAIEQAASRVSDGGLIIFKDIGPRPLWRALANRLHDLVLARQWIHYVEPSDVENWLADKGFELLHRETINMLWYGHELLIFRRQS